MKDPNRPTYPASTGQGGSDFDRFMQSKDESKEPVSLAKCLLDIIEKAINVQFQDFMGNLVK